MVNDNVINQWPSIRQVFSSNIVVAYLLNQVTTYFQFQFASLLASYSYITTTSTISITTTTSTPNG